MIKKSLFLSYLILKQTPIFLYHTSILYLVKTKKTKFLMRIVLFISFILCCIFSLITEFLFPLETTLQLVLNICSLLSGVLMFLFFILNESKLKTKIKEYYQYSFVKDDTIKKLEAEVSHKNQVIVDFQEEIEEKTKANENLSSQPKNSEELENAKNHIHQLNSTVQLKENEISNLQSKIDSQTNSLASISTNDTQNEELDRAKETVSSLSATLAEKDIEISNLKSEVKNWCNKVEELNSNLSTSSEDAILIDDNHIDDTEESERTKEKCLAFLEMIKWSNHNFNCSKCENTNYNTLENLNSRKCTKCNHIESAMAHTLYMGVRFPLDKAFDMTKSVMNNPKIGIEQLMEETGLTKNTCWKFKNKILEQRTAFKKKFKRNPEHWEELIYIK